MAKRTNTHDPDKYPLWTNDPFIQFERTCRLLSLLIHWGSTNKVWAEFVGVSEKTVERWIDNPGTMPSEKLEKTCQLLGVSKDNLMGAVDAPYDSGDPLLARPTLSEVDRYSPEDVGHYYKDLSESNQRLVTSLIKELAYKEFLERYNEEAERRIRRKVLALLEGELSEDDIDQLHYELTHDRYLDTLDYPPDNVVEYEAPTWDEIKTMYNKEIKRLKDERSRVIKEQAKMREHVESLCD